MGMMRPWHLLVLLGTGVVLLALVAGVIAVVVVLVTRSASQNRAAAPSGAAQVGVGQAPPGWYPQPDGTQRWWDGQQWTTAEEPPPEE